MAQPSEKAPFETKSTERHREHTRQSIAIRCCLVTEPIEWIGTPEACARLGVTLRTLYRFIDEGQLPAYKMGRVIRLQVHEVDAFIERARIEPGTLEHLYPDPRGHANRGLDSDAGSPADGGAEGGRGGEMTGDGRDEDDARGSDQEGS